MDDYSDVLDLILNSGRQSYIPHSPSPAQQAFLRLECREALYGGAAGGGKSDALLMAALQYVHVPNYAAIIFRRTFQDLSLPDGLIPRSHEWLAGTDARYDAQNHVWEFPGNAKLAFGYMDSPRDHYRYQGSAFQSINFDELTQFEEFQYLYMFSRLRALQGSPVPLKVRGSSNPGGIGHRWVHRRFIDPVTKKTDAVYVPARLQDNPFLRSDYSESLMYLDEVTRKRYMDGDWSVTEDDIFVYPFSRSEHVGKRPSDEASYYKRRVIGADPGKRDPYAVEVLGLAPDGVWWVLDEFYETGGTSQVFSPRFKAAQEKWVAEKWYVDKRRSSDVLDLWNAGLPAVANLDVHGENERDTIRPMISVVWGLMHVGKLMVDERCTHTIYEFESYRYKDADTKNAGEVPLDRDNHAMDAIRYALCSALEGSDREPEYRGKTKLFKEGYGKSLVERLGTPAEEWKRQDEAMDWMASQRRVNDAR